MEFIEIQDDGTTAPVVTNITVETMPNENMVSLLSCLNTDLKDLYN